MMRTLLRLVRGRVRPSQLVAATLLAALLGFVPSYPAQPVWTALLAVLLLFSGGNLILAVLVWIPARLLAAAALPISFRIGQFLLDGPTSGLFRTAINAPGTALLGLEYYALTGGVPLALVFGGLAGAVVVRFTRDLRLRVAGLEPGSDGWNAVFRTIPGRLSALVFGSSALHDEPERLRVSWRKLIAVGVAVLLVALLRVAPGPLLRPLVVSELETYNGATVDLAGLELDVGAGRLELTGLALADPADLATDLFRATRVEADVSATDLLRKRMILDRVVATDARQGAPRDERGVLVGEPPEPEPEPEPVPGETPPKTIDDYLEDVREVRERLSQVREWLEKISGPEDAEPETSEELDERLEREVAEKGYALVAAEHLRDVAATVHVRELAVEGLVAESMDDDLLDVRAYDLSTHPHLVDGSPKLAIRSASGQLVFEVVLGGLAAGDGSSGLLLDWKGLDTDALLGQLALDGEPLVSGGTIDLSLRGDWSGGDVGRIDLPLEVTVRDGSWRVGGGKPTPIAALTIPLGLSGPIDALRVRFDDRALRDALVDAGQAELARRLEDEASSKLDELLQKGDEELGDKVDEDLKDQAKGLLKGLLGDD